MDNQDKVPVINRDWCKGCGICAAFCPKNVLEIDTMQKSTVVRPEDCISCGMCEIRCPDMAIELVEKAKDHGQ